MVVKVCFMHLHYIFSFNTQSTEDAFEINDALFALIDHTEQWSSILLKWHKVVLRHSYAVLC